jgi:trimethylamine--corrinoid protein Co-methyltransferase
MRREIPPSIGHRFWPEESLEAVHLASLEVLARAGVRVESPRARGVLLAAGCLEGPDARLLVPEEVVAEALTACPSSFSIAAGPGGKDLVIDAAPAQTYVHNVGDTRDAVDPRSGETRRAGIADLARMTRVLQHLDHVHAVVPPHQPAGVPDELEDLYAMLIMAAETDKPIIGPGISSSYQVRHLHEMSVARCGADGSAGRCSCLFGISPVSPLRLGVDVTEAMLDAAALNGTAILALPCPQIGTTAPGSLTAALALQNAEALAVITLLQAALPGSPVLFGARLSGIDPRSGRFTTGTPEMGLCAVAAVLLMRSYGIATDCFGPTSCARVIDAQFGWQHAINAFLGLAAAPRFLSGATDMHSAEGTSPEAAVLDEEILGDLSYVLGPRSFDSEVLNVDAIVDGALRGGYLSMKHTRRYLRSELRRPGVAFVGERRDWAARGHSSVVDAATERVAELVAMGPLGLSDDLAAAMSQTIAAAAKEAGLSEWPRPDEVLASAAEVDS